MGLLKIIRKSKKREKEMRILMLGLDNAGKTTVLLTYCEESTSEIPPTVGFNIKTMLVSGYKVNVWDVGGQKSIRSFWRNYFDTTDGLIWVVDSFDTHRLLDCREELHRLLKEERLAGASLLVLANKQDLPGSLSPEEIEKILSIEDIRKSRHCSILGCSSRDFVSVKTGIDWIIHDIEQFNPVVFDLGSSSGRAGWAGHDQPKFVESSYMRRSLKDGSIDPIPLRFQGKRTQFSDQFDVTRVLHFNPVPNQWELDEPALAGFVNTVLFSNRGLHVNPLERPLFSTCPTGAPAELKSKLYQHFMESVQVPALFLGDTSVLGMYASGRVSGLSVDVGHTATTIARVDKGKVEEAKVYPVGGELVDQYIVSKLDSAIEGPANATESFFEHSRLAIARELKLSACRCSHHALPPPPPAGRLTTRSVRSKSAGPTPSPTARSAAEQAVPLKLPDGSEIDVGPVHEYAAEQLFVPQGEFPGLSSAVQEMTRADDFILLTGGSSHFHGLHTRIVNDLSSGDVAPCVFPFSQWTHRHHSAFVGGSILASLSSFSSLWVTPASYAEHGPDRLVNMK